MDSDFLFFQSDFLQLNITEPPPKPSLRANHRTEEERKSTKFFSYVFSFEPEMRVLLMNPSNV